MKRFARLLPFVLIGLAGATSAVADERSAPAFAHGGGRGHHLRHFERCLSSVGLSPDQQAAVQSIQSESKPILQTDFAALRTVREKLQADRSSGADKSVLGQDVMDEDAASAKVKSDLKATHDQIVAKLNPDQQTALTSCMQQHHGMGDAASEEQPQQ